MSTLARALPRARTPRSIARWLRGALSLRRQRSRLADLDDRILRDIGITRAEAEAEANRPVWDVPPGWRRN